MDDQVSLRPHDSVSHREEPIPPRSPERDLRDFEPLVTAAACYPALERAALQARRSIWLWFRIFDPSMALISEEARATGAKTWADLLRARAEAGVDVAVAMSDFDPIGATALHGNTHRNAAAMEPLLATGRVHLLVAEHCGRTAWVWRCATWPLAILRVEQERRKLLASADPAAGLSRLPGFGRWLRSVGRRVVWSGLALPPLMPATHHQKIAVFDGDRAIIGGLDVDQRRYDSPDHDNPAPQTWRDVSVAVDGPVAADIARHVASCWNYARARCHATGLPRLDPPPAPGGDVAASSGPTGRLSRTISRRRSRGWATLSPRPRVTELEADHVDLIASARKLLYLETQFLRSSAIVQALRRAAAAQPDLGLIVVLPAAPEDVAFDGERGVGARHGEFLQARAVRRLWHAFGDRVVFLSPARPAKNDANNRAAHLGAHIVYVHSKVAIADTHTALVSSANLNGRSLRWDTEAGVCIRGEEPVTRLRDALFRTLLPDDAPAKALAPETAVETWREIASRNRRRHPEGRRGFLLPYPEHDARDFGREIPNLPEEMV